MKHLIIYSRALTEDLLQIKQSQKNDTLTEGYFLADMFDTLKAIVRQYKGSFDGKRIRESDLLRDLTEMIADYNEDRLIRLLVN